MLRRVCQFFSFSVQRKSRNGGLDQIRPSTWTCVASGLSDGRNNSSRSLVKSSTYFLFHSHCVFSLRDLTRRSVLFNRGFECCIVRQMARCFNISTPLFATLHLTRSKRGLFIYLFIYSFSRSITEYATSPCPPVYCYGHTFPVHSPKLNMMKWLNSNKKKDDQDGDGKKKEK